MELFVPSRAMIITGKSLFNIDPTGNTIDEKILTLPEFLEKRGYHTFHIGKWHNGKKAFSKIFKDGSNIFLVVWTINILFQHTNIT